MRNVWWLAVALAIGGCDDGESGGGGGEGGSGEPDMRRRIRNMDEGVEPEPDMGQSPQDEDAGDPPDVPEPDANVDPGVRNLPDCDAICAVYVECEALEELWGGDLERCINACSDAEPSPRFPSYLACMQVTSCENIDECIVPPKPPPRCDEVCDAIEACEAEFRLPSIDCMDACADEQVGRTMVECGEAVVDAAPEACDEPGFARCLLDDLATECMRTCDARALCADAQDPIDCAIECQANPPMPLEDPIAERRRNNTRSCLLNAEDCETVQACGVRPPVEIDAQVVAGICAANAECPFFAPDECEATVAALLPELAEGGPACLLTHLTDRCGDPIYGCFEPSRERVGECQELCTVRALCEILPGDQTEFECTEACQNSVREGGQDFLSYRRQLACAFSDTCEDLSACLESTTPEAMCEALCTTQTECGHFGAEDCPEDCADFDELSIRRELMCFPVAADCEVATRCVTPDPADCTLICDRFVECGGNRPPCVNRCNEEALADRAAFADRVACVASSARCDDVTACVDEDPARGLECVAWCRDQADCVIEDPSALEQCTADCGENAAPGATGIEFDNAGACLAEAGGDAMCEEYDACIAEPEFTSFCGRYCEELGRCLLDEDAEACVADCEANDEEEFINGAACALNARRRAAGCGPVAECIGAEVEPAGEPCVALCARRIECGEDLDPFLCERECAADPAAAPIQAACAGLAECDQLPACLEAPALPNEDCIALCTALDECEGVLGEGEDAPYPDAVTCLTECSGAAILDDAEFVSEAAPCVADAACDRETIDACLDPIDPVCQGAWDAVVTCMSQLLFGDNEEMFIAQCQAAIDAQGDLARLSYQCMVDSVNPPNPLCIITQALCGI